MSDDSDVAFRHLMWVKLYRAGLWLTNKQRKRIIDALEDLLESASYAYRLGWVRFKYQPKFHLIADMICSDV